MSSNQYNWGKLYFVISFKSGFHISWPSMFSISSNHYNWGVYSFMISSKSGFPISVPSMFCICSNQFNWGKLYFYDFLGKWLSFSEPYMCKSWGGTKILCPPPGLAVYRLRRCLAFGRVGCILRLAGPPHLVNNFPAWLYVMCYFEHRMVVSIYSSGF